jgi:hypothetical protein
MHWRALHGRRLAGWFAPLPPVPPWDTGCSRQLNIGGVVVSSSRCRFRGVVRYPLGGLKIELVSNPINRDALLRCDTPTCAPGRGDGAVPGADSTLKSLPDAILR